MNSPILPSRPSDSHKGQNGRVLILGGNEFFHGAPILAALGAEKSGIDLLFLCLPAKHAPLARQKSLNFIVHEFQKSHLSSPDIPHILSLAQHCDTVLIGNGLGTASESQTALLELLGQFTIPVILDAEALIPQILTVPHKNSWTLTPHEKEFERVFGIRANETTLKEFAQKQNVTILKKGKVDVMTNETGTILRNATGNEHMTVGGSGDALAGIIAGLQAQKILPLQSCQLATFLWGECGDRLFSMQETFTAEDMLHFFPKMLKSFPEK